VPQRGATDGRVVCIIRANTRAYDLPILLLTPPPVDEVAWRKHCELQYGETGPSSRTNSRAEEYGKKVKAAAGSDVACAVVDVWELLQGETDERGKYLSDGLHLNGAGNAKVFEGIMEAIKKHFPSIAPMEDGDGKNGLSGLALEEQMWRDLV
jgi:lysophospholipase L1-like esterase